MKQKIGKNSSNNQQAGKNIININLFNFNIGDTDEKSILKFFTSWLLPKITGKKEISKIIIKPEINTNEIDETEILKILSSFLDRELDLELYNYFLKLNSELQKKVILRQYFWVSCINLSINNFKVSYNYLREAINFHEKLSESEAKYFNIANAYLGMELYTKAIENYKKAISINPNMAEFYKNLGSCYKAIGNDEEAYEYYFKSLKLSPYLYEALMSLGIFEIKNDNIQKANDFFEKVISEKLPLNRKYNLFCWKALTKNFLKDYEKTHIYIQSAISINENESYIWNDEYIWKFASYFYYHARRRDNTWLEISIDFWEKYIIKYPEDSLGFAELGYSYYKKASRDDMISTKKAKDFFNSALLLEYKDENTGLVWDRLGHLEEYLGNYKEAEAYFLESVFLNKRNFSYCLGMCYLDQELNEKALPYLKISAEEYNKNEYSWFHLGVCYVKLNDIKNAEKAFRKSIEINGEYEKPYFELGGLYWNNKNYLRALEIWNFAKEKFPESQNIERLPKFMVKN